MPCYHPRLSYRLEDGTISFRPKEALEGCPLNLPCGQCIGCRIERSRQWAIRCIHEASLHENNCFITLTYREEDLPENGSLDKTHFQKFIRKWRQHNVAEARKRLGFKKRQRLKPHQRAALRHATPTLRYYYCGEYGEKLSRPHFHACVFGTDFADKTLWQRRKGVPLYRSETLEKLWPHGFATIGDVTFESAAYVARYIMKKMNGDLAKDHYERLDPYGEYIQITPEFTDMSRKPGIGNKWFAKYTKDVFPGDYVIHGGKKLKTPKYYDRLYDLSSPIEFEDIKFQRLQNARKHAADNSYERLRVREECQMAKLKQLIRTFEND